MRAVEVPRFGGPDVLAIRERPNPVAGPGQAVVDVAVIPLLWLDTALRSGAARAWLEVSPPFVPGTGVAGTVRTVGAGVDRRWVGRAVLADTGRTGAYADRVAVAAAGLVAIPDGVTMTTAAGLLTDGRTAARLAEDADLAPGMRVLITGAAGGMGLLLVQMAKARGARVVGAARGRRKLEAIMAQGADAAVDYGEPGWTDRVLEAHGGHRADVVLDGVGGAVGSAAFTITANGGAFSAHGAASGGFAPIDPASARERGVTLRGIADVQLAPEERRRLLERVLAEAAAGALSPVIDRAYALEDAAEAHARIEAREVVGKALLMPGG
jgi:NADPH2:quinone reductase